jgi:glucokinase-like ROK family protein
LTNNGLFAIKWMFHSYHLEKPVGIFFPSPLPSISNAKNLNKRIVLDLVRFTPGGISRADLARQTSLTRAAITAMVNDMVVDGLIRETDTGPATGGRRPILLEVNPQRGYIVGVDMGASHISILISDFAARVLDDMEVPSDVSLGPKVCLSRIDEAVQSLLGKNGLTIQHVLAVGLGVPGPIVAEAGLVSTPPIMPGWHNYPIRTHLEKVWNCPVSVNNDAELGALGEWAYGAGRGERHLAYIKVGSGVGAGLLLDGRIYRGATGCAGEIGHITILNDGPQCSCGNYGCLEALSGGHAIARRAQEAISAGKRTIICAQKPETAISARDVIAAARLGDLVAQQIVAEAGAYLGTAVASLVNLFNPNVIVVGGGVSFMGDLLLEPIRKGVRERSLPSAGQAVRISAALLGRRSSAMGAVVQALNLVSLQLTES